MSCIKCNSSRIAEINAHSKDLGSFTYDTMDIDHKGYFPDIPGICDGDDANIEFCLECGMIQASFPITDETIKAALYDEDEDDDEYIAVIHKIELANKEIISVRIPSDLFQHPYVKNVSMTHHFEQFLTTIDPIKGKMLIGIMFDKENDILTGKDIAYIPVGYLNNLMKVEWSEYITTRV